MTTRPPIDAGKLKTLLAVAGAGSPAAAASALRVQPSSLYRQMKALEDEVGGLLFHRRKGAWTLTALGESLAGIAAELDSKLRDFSRLAAAQDNLAQGLIRVTASDAPANFYLAGKLAGFREAYPNIMVELLVTNRRLDLANGEADIALRPHSEPGNALVGRRVGNMRHAVYAKKSYLAGKPVPRSAENLSGHAILAYGSNLQHFNAAQWTSKILNGANPASSFDTVTALARAVEGGMGLAVLPCFVGDQLQDTRALFPAPDELTADIWLLYAKARRQKKITNFVSYFAECFRRDAKRFEG